MKKSDNLALTSVKIHKDLLSNFKQDSLGTGLSMQKLVNRTINMFLTDPEFKLKILTYNNLATSGSL
jgi:hypothetical protein